MKKEQIFSIYFFIIRYYSFKISVSRLTENTEKKYFLFFLAFYSYFLLLKAVMDSN
jgi:hypothetical protein